MELVGRSGGPPVRAGGFHDEQSLQHVHAATEVELPRFLWGELDGRGLEGGRRHVVPEALEQTRLEPVRVLFAVELTSDRRPAATAVRVGGEAPLHCDATSLAP